jgi:hypothetical protein
MPTRFGNKAVVPQRRARVITAATSQLPTAKPTGRSGVPVWQQQAWDFFDQIGEVRYGARYYGNSLSRLRLFIGWRESPSEPVVPIDSEDLPAGLDRATFEVAENTVSRLHSTDGSIAELLRAYGVNLFVAGEGYIVGRTDADTGREVWEFLSVEQVVWHDNKWKLRQSVADTPAQYVTLNLDEDVVRRVWLPHPRFAQEADAPMRAVLTICEELLLLSASVRASALSRMSAGVMVMPDTMLEGGPDTYIEGDGTDGESQADRTLQDLVDHFVKPIGDPTSAAAVAPFILTGDPEDVDKVRLLEPSRSVDEVAAKQRGELLVRLANGVDLPPEVLTGYGDTNHWGAWLIDEQTFRTHIAPAAQLFTNAVTEELVWPSVQAAGLPVDQRLVVGFDASDLVGHPDRKSNAEAAYQSLTISDEAYRRALGFAEEDAPDAEEYARRVALRVNNVELYPIASGNLERMPELLPVVEEIVTGPVAELPAVPVASGDEPSDVVAGPPQQEGLTAAARRKPTDFGLLLARLDRALFDRLQQASSDALTRALERAGARLRSRLARDPELKPLVAGVAAIDVASVVGRDAVVAAGVIEDELVEDEAFEEVAVLFLSLTGRAQKRVTRELVDVYGLSDAEADAMGQRQSEARQIGAASLVAGLAGLAVGALYQPKPSAPAVGESDPTARVPAGVVRSALSEAGGGPPTVKVDVSGRVVNVPPVPDQPPALAVEGPITRDFGGSVGLIETGFIWDYGPDDRDTFEPHFALDGEQFAGPEDSGLTNDEPFPPDPFYYPGDHAGCMCSTVPIYSAIAVEGD